MQCDGERDICAENLSDDMCKIFDDTINAGVFVAPEVFRDEIYRDALAKCRIVWRLCRHIGATVVREFVDAVKKLPE